MNKKYINDLLELIIEYKNHFMWGVVILVSLLIGQRLRSSDGIYIVTGLIIFFYTFETYKMRKAIAESTELNTSPILVLEMNFSQKKAFIKNFGNFPAYNFKIEDYHFELGQHVHENHLHQEDSLFNKDFPFLDVIPPKDRLLILDGETVENDKVFFTLLNPYIPLTTSEQFTFKATAFYDDISNNSWKMIIGYGPGNIIATKPQKVQRKKTKVNKQKEGERG